MRMAADSMKRSRRTAADGARCAARGTDRVRRGIGNTGFALANVAGKITLMSLSSTCVFTGAAPSFCPLTNLVGP